MPTHPSRRPDSEETIMELALDSVAVVMFWVSLGILVFGAMLAIGQMLAHGKQERRVSRGESRAAATHGDDRLLGRAGPLA
jgi:hypothetical protein